MRPTRRQIAALPALAASAALAARAAPRRLRLLILGGTGFIGPYQVRYALARGHQVTLFNRGRQKPEWPGKVEELIGDRDTGDLKALAGRDWDAVIDNPTTLPAWVRDAGATLRGHTGTYIFISTVSVYAANDKPGADESAALAPYAGRDAMAETTATLRADVGGLYGPLKALAEAEARRQFGAQAAIVRPGLIVGPGDPTDRFTYWPVRLARGGDVLAPGDGADPVQFVDARDVAEWTVRLAERRTAGVFNALGPARPLTMAQMLDGIDRGVSAHPHLAWVPASFLDAEKIEAWSDMPVWVPAAGDSLGFHRRGNRAAVAAGLTFRPVSLTAAETLAWFKTLPAERQAKLRAGLTPEREAAVLARWRARK
ncbi:MAG TPA: NAD-dependent epimerase/dehydratase family protein [Caulobacteraceae bacterium]|jgi:2'-hydroxyisoflavone reductase|nr:NAD-dependent epimerase/dehydratase family protein [Caulobacteraceae bacterium]